MTTMTTTRVAHSDTTVRRTANGVTFAHDESTRFGTTYCLECHRETEAVVLVTILNDEEWDYADDDYSTHCGACLSDRVCDPQDAEHEEREMAEDAAAEYRYDSLREREW